VDSRNDSGTTIQQADLQERRLHIEKSLAAFRAIQAAYMPEAICFITAHPPNDQSESRIETQTLYLPSQLPPSVTISNPRIAAMEQQLRYAQASDAIVTLRQSLTVRAHLNKYKQDQVRGQHSNTRARTLLNKAEARTEGIANRYRAARASHLTLAGPGEWETILRPLRAQDIRSLSTPEDNADRVHGALGEGHRTLSWIWIAAGGVDPDSPDMHEGESVSIILFTHKFTNCSMGCSMQHCE
jgi:hypothetical protein